MTGYIAILAGLLAVWAGATTAQERRLADLLDQDFDAVVATIDAESLREFAPEDAVYLIGQAAELAPLADSYGADLLETYAFTGTAGDLAFFLMVEISAIPSIWEGYCSKVGAAMTADLPADCLDTIGAVLTRQYGKGIPAEIYSPQAMDILYQVTGDDALVIPETISDLSADRALRLLGQTGDFGALPEPAQDALVNGYLCAPDVRDAASLAPITGVCRADPITPDAQAAAAKYRVLAPMLSLCATADNTRACYLDLTTIHTLGRRCQQPLHFEQNLGWYDSVMFKTCMATFVPQ